MQTNASGVDVSIFIDNEDGSNDVFIVKNATIEVIIRGYGRK